MFILLFLGQKRRDALLNYNICLQSYIFLNEPTEAFQSQTKRHLHRARPWQ